MPHIEDIEGAVDVALVDHRPRLDIRTVERAVSAIIEAVAAEHALVSVVRESIRDDHPSSVVLASALERFEKAQAANWNPR